MTSLLNVDDAVARILVGIARLPAEAVPLDEALGRVLANDIRSDVNIPPFANSSMDGFAVRAEDLAGASAEKPAILRVVVDIPAGAFPDTIIHAGEAARIMTGAPMPEGADTIVPVEQTDSQFVAGADEALPAQVSIYKGSRAGDYVRPVGEDIQAGAIVLKAGIVLRPQEIGVLAALGSAQVAVVRRPRVAILSTGDELVGVDEPLAPGKIRDTNSYTLAGLVKTYGGDAVRIPAARDTLDDVRRCFRQALEAKPDLLMSSAGVSVGTFDMVRTVLAELGQVDFWRVNLRPGKPLAFGQIQGIPFFGLPGNPVSAMVTFDVFVRPVLLRMSDQPDAWQTVMSVTGESIASDGRRSYVRVKLKRENGQWIATTTGTQSSGALTSMVQADGLLIIPENVTDVPAGSQLEVRLLKSIV
jgi:molybdopterin molybdotransferase